MFGLGDNASLCRYGLGKRFQTIGSDLKNTITSGLVIAICLSLFTLFVGCSDSDSGGSTPLTPSVFTPSDNQTSDAPAVCSVVEENEFVYDLMTDVYFWYRYIPLTIPASYGSPYELLDAIRYKKLDRWSYITTQEEFKAYDEESRYIGVGFAIDYDLSGDLRVLYVHPGSPADIAGMKRGDTILTINGRTIQEIELFNLWESIWGNDAVGMPLNLTIVHLSSHVQEAIHLVERWIDIRSVLKKEVIDVGSKKVAYLMLTEFIKSTQAELDTAFGEFKSANVSDLILDLRYNTGGRVNVAQYLAGLIGGFNTQNRIFAKFSFNDKLSDNNESIEFPDPAWALDLSRVIVITGPRTASASEMVINGLKPFLDVILVGDCTHGKPVAMIGFDFCDLHISPIVVETFNADDEGRFYDGFAPDCYSLDDVDHMFGDIEEDSMKQALYYQAYGVCSAGRTAQGKSISDTPDERSSLPMQGFRREIGAF